MAYVLSFLRDIKFSELLFVAVGVAILVLVGFLVF
jgi:hypothetical protein